MSTFSNRLEELRALNKWSKSETARHLGIPVSTYSNYEYGNREPDIETIGKIAKLYEVSTDYLMGLTNSKSQPLDRATVKKVDLAKEPVILAYDGEVASKEETDTVKNILKLIKSHGKN